jgi:ribonucleoside-diphosphate reductase alpha chain
MKKDRIGPSNAVSQELHKQKYRQHGESFDDYCVRYARTVSDDEKHFRKLLHGLRTQAILPGGRQQRAVGWPYLTTAFNCFVGGEVADDLRSIMNELTDAAMTLRSGGGCGWNFGTLRPMGEPVRTLGEGASASGPVSFMGMWHAMCSTIMSAGERRGAMMGVMPIDHPDVMRFVHAKRDRMSLTNFNISIGISDSFMEALYADKLFALQFGGKVFSRVRAADVWAAVMENNWDWAEPGALFLGTINRMNPLAYCETIHATNPCAEQPLPTNGACLLASLNVTEYLVPRYSGGPKALDYERFADDADVLVRACDNVFEHTVFPLEQQKREALMKRRMGVGVTGVANALEMCGASYGTADYIAMQDQLLETLRDAAYRASIQRARERGSFPLFDAAKWLSSGFARTLPDDIRAGIMKHGLRNGLLLSIAPTGTISMCANNISSGIEPPAVTQQVHTLVTQDGTRQVELDDWAFAEHGHRCRTALECSAEEHVAVLCAAQKYIDSSVSKTVNVRGAKAGEDGMPFNEFTQLYRMAYDGGAKGCATFNVNGKRQGVIEEQANCSIDTRTGARSCG